VNGVHDMGGQECHGAIDVGPDTKFHDDWEKQVLAITLAMGATGTWNLDQSRFARESLIPSRYLSIGYYRVWLEALESLLLQFDLVSDAELKTGSSIDTPKNVKRILEAGTVASVLKKGGPVDRAVTSKARYSVGDEVTVNNLHNPGHTRLPGYIRNCTGVIHKIHGAHVYPDSNALGLGEDPQWLYNVRFSAQELWGKSRPQHSVVHVDCWEPYLGAENSRVSAS